MMTYNKSQNTDFVLYSNENEQIKLEVYLQDETLWLTQKMMAELFDVEVNTINYHLKEIFNQMELIENSVIRKIRTTASDGKKYKTNFYHLDAIIAVGYRVNSKRATQFRIWATQVLDEKQIKRLERTISGFFDYIEGLVEKRNTFTMQAFAETVDKFLSFNEYKILDGKGLISKKQADQKALKEYNKFNKIQPIKSDFEKIVKNMLTNRNKDIIPN